jgi:hypothetical protein
MSSKPIEPEDIVSDGVEGGEKPIPREESGAGSAGTAPDAPEKGAPAGQAPPEGDTQKVPGPAEEDDEKTADDRGLTTDTTPD